MLPPEAIAEYQVVYKKVLHKKISFNKATELANKLINLIMLIERPIKNESNQIPALKGGAFTPRS